MDVEKDDHRFLFKLTALSCIGGFLFGYDTGVISGALVLIDDDFNLTDVQEELVVGMTIVGALISAASAGLLSDLYGRKVVIIISSLMFILGSLLLSVFAINYTALLVGRLVVGLGVGAASMIMPMYVCEASPPHIRGQMVTYINVAITGGQFFSACIDGGFSGVAQGWKIMLGLAAVPAFIQLVGFYYMPESPRWLIEQSRIDEATRVIRDLRGKRDVRDEVQDIINCIRSERAEGPDDLTFEYFLSQSTTTSPLSKIGHEASGVEKLKVPAPGNGNKKSLCKRLMRTTVLRALLVGCAMQAAQQFGGINTVMYYSASILKIAGFTTNREAIWLTVVVSFCNFVGSIIGLHLVDRIGRRVLTLTSLGAVCVFLAGIGVAFYFTEHCSPRIEVDTGGSCGSYQWCFDCVQDSNCGYCSNVIATPTAASALFQPLSVPMGSGCVSTASDSSSFLNLTQSSLFDARGVAYSYSCSTADLFETSCAGSKPFGWLIFACLCMYLLAFAPGMGTMPWCVNSEIYPTSVRGVANSIATTANWGSNLIMSMSFLSIISALSRQGAFWLYSGISLLFFVFLYFYLPETHNVPLENVEDLFTDECWGQAYATPPMLTSHDHLSGDDNEAVSSVDANGAPYYRKLMASNIMPGSPPVTYAEEDEEGLDNGVLNRAYDMDDSSLDINAMYSTLMRTNTTYDYRDSPSSSSNLRGPLLVAARSGGFDLTPTTSPVSKLGKGSRRPGAGHGATGSATHGPPIDSPKTDAEIQRRHSYDNFVSSGRKDKVRRHLISSILNSPTALEPVNTNDGDDEHDRDSLISV